MNPITTAAYTHTTPPPICHHGVHTRGDALGFCVCTPHGTKVQGFALGICPLETWSVVWSVHLAGASQLHAQTPFGSEAVSTTQCIPRLEGSVFVGESLLDLWSCWLRCSDREQSGCAGTCACKNAIVSLSTQFQADDSVRIAMCWYLQ